MANICLTEYVQVFLISYRQVTEEDGIVVTIVVTQKHPRKVGARKDETIKGPLQYNLQPYRQ